jgi:hypothetical protein
MLSETPYQKRLPLRRRPLDPRIPSPITTAALSCAAPTRYLVRPQLTSASTRVDQPAGVTSAGAGHGRGPAAQRHGAASAGNRSDIRDRLPVVSPMYPPGPCMWRCSRQSPTVLVGQRQPRKRGSHADYEAFLPAAERALVASGALSVLRRRADDFDVAGGGD